MCRRISFFFFLFVPAGRKVRSGPRDEGHVLFCHLLFIVDVVVGWFHDIVTVRDRERGRAVVARCDCVAHQCGRRDETRWWNEGGTI